MKTTNEWICTDSDSQQYVQNISLDNSPHCFNLIEMSLINPDKKTYEVYTDIIFIDEYLNENRGELETIIHSYGYYLDQKSEFADRSIWVYEEDAYQVMAECIFEYYGSSQAEQIFVGYESECIEFIEKIVE